MTSRHCNRQRARCHDSCDGCPPTPSPPCLSSTASGGWTRLPHAASPPSSEDMSSGCATYATATARTPEAPTPEAAPVAQILSLRSILSLRPRTLLCPWTLTNYPNDWDEGNNEAGGREESKDNVSIVKETAETPLAAVPALKNDLAATPTNTDHNVCGYFHI